MSEIAAELARVQSAFDQPTLTLLHQRQAAVVITVFRQAFGRDNRPVPTARLHTLVEGYLAELRDTPGETPESIPSGSGRELCQRWMRGQWLVRSLDETDQEVYTLTWHAQQAVELVKSLARDRATLSQHRISTIVDTVRRFNADANPDPQARVDILDQEIARLAAERDRLLGGGDLPAPSEDYLDEGFTELLSLVAALPSDFARVEERFAQIRGEILAAFRAEDRPAGEVIDGYLARADEMMTTTPEGRAFEGAFTLLRDNELVGRLRADLAALLDHPGADRLLSDADRAELRGTVRLVREGLDRVLSQRSRVTAALKEYIVSHDGARDRELEQTLRQIESELTAWMGSTGPRATVEVALLPARPGVEQLRERFHDPADDLPPERLRTEPTAQSGPELGELLAQGGPTMPELAIRLGDALDRARSGGTPSLGGLFDQLEDELRRPVEIFGLLQLATQRDLAPGDGEEEYRAVRPDGTGRAFAVPRLEVGPATAPADGGPRPTPSSEESPA
ncbi:DUF3375 domain-containing protein [Nocardioides insulae]|uniref:DUF3375 domain-containing protein n=1 Tax=Nocardioides insulae TaxID=394734 RepID=UPI000416EE5A|nr:DUF3375 domain-containing protein [Nocardioides insulae]